MTSVHTESDYELVARLNGIYMGLLSKQEIEAFDRLCDAGLAHREYNLLGMAKARIHAQTT